MEELKQRILRDGKVRGSNEVLKVDSFLNHQMDVPFLQAIGQAFRPVSYTHLTLPTICSV